MQILILRNLVNKSTFDVFKVDFDKESKELLHEGLTFEQAAAIVESFKQQDN